MWLMLELEVQKKPFGNRWCWLKISLCVRSVDDFVGLALRNHIRYGAPEQESPKYSRLTESANGETSGSSTRASKT